MPVVTVNLNGSFALPTEKAVDVEELTFRQALSLYLVQLMPDVVTRAMFEIGIGIKSEIVRTIPKPIPPFSTGHIPDIWIVVSPMASPAYAGKTEKLRDHMRDQIGQLIRDFVSPLRLSHPSYEVEVIFAHGAGVSVDSHGAVFDVWASKD